MKKELQVSYFTDKLRPYGIVIFLSICYSIAVLDGLTTEFMGVVGLQVNKNHNHAELAYWIGKPFWGKGYCTEAAQCVLQFAFREL